MSHGSDSNPSSRGSLAAAAYADLRDRIVRCELAPGTRVTEGRLVEMLRVGKTPVREALTRLSQLGLVRSSPGQGYEVTPITLDSIRDLYGLRLVVEPAAVEMAAGKVDVERLRHLNDARDALGARRGERVNIEAIRINTEFHRSIAEASSNRRMVELVGQLLEQSERLFHLGLACRDRTVDTSKEHVALIDALARADGAEARRIAENHLLASEQLIAEALASA